MVTFRSVLPYASLIAGTFLMLTQKEGNDVFFLRQGKRKLSVDPKPIDLKRRQEKGTVAVIMNTPKSGTGSLHSSFALSFQCYTRTSLPKVTHQYDCKNDMNILRTHDVKAGIDALGAIRHDPHQQKCVVFTAIRDPQAWLPSLFMESPRGGKHLCNSYNSLAEVLRQYHNWIMTDTVSIRSAITDTRVPLFEHFGTNLTVEMEKVEKNGGYSVVPHPVDEAGPFANCELLFLRMEESNRWNDIISNMLPGATFKPNEKGRSELCPIFAQHYEALLQYTLTSTEITRIIGDDDDVAYYFDAYKSKQVTDTKIKLSNK